MKSVRFFDRRAGYSLGAIGLLLGMVLPGVFPAFASAANLTSRSITLSDSSAGAASVSYELKATTTTAIAAAGGMIIEFCDNNPLIGQTCNHPAGLSVASVSASTGTATDIDTTTPGDNATIQWIAGGSGLSAGAADITFSGIHNPTATGTFYARVTTYAGAPDYTDAQNVGTVADQGEVALSTTSSVGVTAYVLESLSFCVANIAPTADCGGLSGHNPSLTLGEAISGGGTALDTGHLSTGTDYAQLSTNAGSGAVVNLKSSTTGCGGLVRAYGGANCDITAQATSGSSALAAGVPKFGLTVGSAASASGATTPSGTLQAINGYDATHYFIDYHSGDATGVTSTYGSGLFDTNSAPVNNKNIPFTFGASISNATPAGIYGATLNLVATGTF